MMYSQNSVHCKKTIFMNMTSGKVCLSVTVSTRSTQTAVVYCWIQNNEKRIFIQVLNTTLRNSVFV